MFWDILKFELTYRFRRPVVYIFTAMFFLMVFSAIASDSVQMGGSIGNAARNSPFEIVRLLSMMSVLGLLALTGFVATAVNRDVEYRTSELFYSTPAGRGAFLMGRFFGSLIAAMFTVCVAALGIAIAAKMPWLDPERIVAFNPVPYLYAVVVFVIPNLFFSGALLFAFATLTRKVLYSYVAMIGFLTLWGVSQAMAGDLNTTLLASLMDPFGKTTLDLATRYWTVVEKNTLLPPLTGRFLLNRLMWTGLGVGLLAFTWARFRMTVGERVLRRRGPAAPAQPPVAPDAAGLPRPLPAATVSFTTRARLAQWMHQTRAEIAGIARSVPFIVIICFGMFNLFGSLIGDFDGTASYPLTRIMISTMEGSFSIFLFIFLLVYAAQVVWRERGAEMHEIHGALPVPDWLPVASKMSALLVVQCVALFAAALTTIGYQMANGYFNLEIGLYLRWILLLQVPMMFAMAALALSMQVFTNNKLVGWGIMIAFFILQEVAYVIGLEHNLVMYAELPTATSLGHERIRALRQAALLVQSLLGPGGRHTRRPVGVLLGARYGRARDDEVARGEAALHPPARGHASGRRACGGRCRRVDLLQHERPEHVHGLEDREPQVGPFRAALQAVRGARAAAGRGRQARHRHVSG